MTVAARLPEDADDDICGVGAGPVGTAVASPHARTGRSVLALEAGGMAPEAGHERLASAFEDAAEPDPHALTTREAFDGSARAARKTNTDGSTRRAIRRSRDAGNAAATRTAPSLDASPACGLRRTKEPGKWARSRRR